MLHQAVAALTSVAVLVPSIATGQRSTGSDNEVASAVAAWVQFQAPPGHEPVAAARLGRTLRGWTTDAHGNLIRRVGSGAPRRIVACGMDFPAYVVSQITAGGYLRLRRAGSSPHPLWDQFHEAQLLTVFTAHGPRHGVVAVPNGHFAQQHRADTVARTADDLWVDIGASSADEVARAGVSLLDPVQIDRPAWTFEGFAAGPAAGARAGCAAVATAAQGTVRSGETIFVLSTHRVYGWRGLAAIMGRQGRVSSLTIVGDGVGGSAPLQVANRLGGRGYGGVARTATADSVRVISPRVRFQGSMVESIHTDDARALLDAVIAAGAVTLHERSWIAPALDTARALPPRGGRLGELERTWMALADLPGVSGHEHLVRQAVLAALPDWARRRAVLDSMGNVIVAMGPDRDSVAFIAHMDEVGFEVTGILGDGRVRMRTRGGAVVPSWEGVPAYLHFDPAGNSPPAAPLRGVFVPRDSGRTRSPGPLTAWFGLDSAALVARGVRPGLMVTAYKRAARLAGTRITGRGSDDRSGTTALLFAIRALQPDALAHKVIFVWSVAEEGGLVGARFFGERHGVNLRRVYSVDTFVSSDSPVESRHFAFAPLGSGPVLRGVDNSSLVPRHERERIIQIARANAIPLQVGTTFGSTDGSSIQIWGPPNIGLSWPGRYSHGPAELLDLRDLDALVRLVVAVAKVP